MTTKCIIVEEYCNNCPNIRFIDACWIKCFQTGKTLGEYDRDYSHLNQDKISIPNDCPLEDLKR